MKNLTTKRWILVVDDDHENRKNLCDSLRAQFGKDIKIVESHDGLDASSKIQNQTFHLIITDMNMPKRTGGELVEAARSDGFNEMTPIVLMSASESENIEREYKFINFVKKPVQTEAFIGMIKNLFQLGSTEKMISASIFNSLIDSSIAFLEESLKRSDFEVGKMAIKKRGEYIEAEQAAIISVQVGKVSNTFSVLCTNRTLETIRDGSERIAGKSLEVICRSLGYVILKYVLTDCGIIDSNEVRTKDITQNPEILTRKQGICVPIHADGIDYKVFATTKGGDA